MRTNTSSKTSSSAEHRRVWREQGGIIYFSVTSNGMTGKQWIVHLEARGFRVHDYAKSLLVSPDFKPTNGVITEIAVLKGVLFHDDDRITTKIRLFASERKLANPNSEVACLIRDKFSEDEIRAMGLRWILAMHEPIQDPLGDPAFLNVGFGPGGNWLSACQDIPDQSWNPDDGFALAVS